MSKKDEFDPTRLFLDSGGDVLGGIARSMRDSGSQSKRGDSKSARRTDESIDRRSEDSDDDYDPYDDDESPELAERSHYSQNAETHSVPRPSEPLASMMAAPTVLPARPTPPPEQMVPRRTDANAKSDQTPATNKKGSDGLLAFFPTRCGFKRNSGTPDIARLFPKPIISNHLMPHSPRRAPTSPHFCNCQSASGLTSAQCQTLDYARIPHQTGA